MEPLQPNPHKDAVLKISSLLLSRRMDDIATGNNRTHTVKAYNENGECRHKLPSNAAALAVIQEICFKDKAKDGGSESPSSCYVGLESI